jgi:hypothetical protein
MSVLSAWASLRASISYCRIPVDLPAVAGHHRLAAIIVLCAATVVPHLRLGAKTRSRPPGSEPLRVITVPTPARAQLRQQARRDRSLISGRY